MTGWRRAAAIAPGLALAGCALDPPVASLTAPAPALPSGAMPLGARAEAPRGWLEHCRRSREDRACAR